MNRLRFDIFISVAILFVFFLSDSPEYVNAQQTEQKLVCFRWAFGAVIGAKDDRRLVAITRDTVLKTGDQLKMLVELQKKCFVYLIYHTGEEEVHLLFPYNLQQFDTDYEIAKRYYIPQGNKWFQLDKNVGLETFYLLGSAQRIYDLEALWIKYNSTELGKKKELAKEILKKIRKIKRQRKTFTTSAERPIQIGGNIRGTTQGDEVSLPDIDSIAAEVSETHFYSRTFTIEHQ